LPNSIDAAIGLQIQMKRSSLGMNMADLACQLGVSACDMGAFESGQKHIAADLLLRLASILGVAPGYFFETLHSQRDSGNHI